MVTWTRTLVVILIHRTSIHCIIGDHFILFFYPLFSQKSEFHSSPLLVDSFGENKGLCFFDVVHNLLLILSDLLTLLLRCGSLSV
jgi:hypothetical protein